MNLRTLTLVAVIAFAFGCGNNSAPIRPVVKQEIPPDKVVKPIDPSNPPGQEKKGGLTGN
jgi:hypothetical protein